jgi:hypothetical protein
MERRFYQNQLKRVNTILQIFLAERKKDTLPPNKPEVEPAKNPNKDLKKNDEGMTKSECRKLRIVPIAI